ncbi:MAG: hypothetical protein H7Y17_09040, partial [Chlorobia bacterium]|nr:hypothetical protein [Fimbriimonadaceae bacterium]
MKKILKFVTISVLGASLVASAFAQASGPAGGGVQNGSQGAAGKQGKQGRAGSQKGLQKIEAELWAKLTPALTSEQKVKIEQLNQKTKDAFKALKDKAKNGDKEALRGEMKKIQTQRRESIQAILTPEQKKSYAELAKAAMEKMR